MGTEYEEWLKQADYDLDTARSMLREGRCFYAVFMCHMSIEKALKGLYQAKMKEVPPKTHNLLSLLRNTACKPEEALGQFIAALNEANVATRYPEDIESLQASYPPSRTQDIISRTDQVLKWIKTQF